MRAKKKEKATKEDVYSFVLEHQNTSVKDINSHFGFKSNSLIFRLGGLRKIKKELRRSI